MWRQPRRCSDNDWLRIHLDIPEQLYPTARDSCPGYYHAMAIADGATTTHKQVSHILFDAYASCQAIRIITQADSYTRKFAHIFEDEVRVWTDQDAATMKGRTSAQNHDTW